MIGLDLIRREYLIGEDLNIVSKSYCGICTSLRANYCTLASFLVDDEAQFISLLITAQKKESPSDSLTKCPIYFGARKFPILGDEIALQYAATVAVLLIGEKLDDNIRDENTFLTKFLRKIFLGKFERAQNIIAKLGFSLERLAEIRREQISVERKTGFPLEYYLEPTANIVKEIFSQTATLANAPENLLILNTIGFSVGKIIALIDAVEDIHLDKKSKQVNPIISSHGSEEMISVEVIKDVSFIFMKELCSIREAILRLNIYRFEAVIENVLTRGLPERIMKALAFFWRSNHWSGKLDLQRDLDLDLQAIQCPYCHQPHYFSGQYSAERNVKPIRAPKNLWVITSSLFENANELATQLGFQAPEDYLFTCLFPSIVIENTKVADWKNRFERIKRIANDQNMN